METKQPYAIHTVSYREGKRVNSDIHLYWGSKEKAEVVAQELCAELTSKENDNRVWDWRISEINYTKSKPSGEQMVHFLDHHFTDSLNSICIDDLDFTETKKELSMSCWKVGNSVCMEEWEIKGDLDMMDTKTTGYINQGSQEAGKYINQSNQYAKKNINQDGQWTKGDISQNEQEAKGDIDQTYQKAGKEIDQGGQKAKHIQKKGRMEFTWWFMQEQKRYTVKKLNGMDGFVDVSLNIPVPSGVVYKAFYEYLKDNNYDELLSSKVKRYKWINSTILPSRYNKILYVNYEKTNPLYPNQYEVWWSDTPWVRTIIDVEYYIGSGYCKEIK